MLKLNDYLYSGHTITKVIHLYAKDLQKSAMESRNEIDWLHSEQLMQFNELLEYTDFLTVQSQKIKDLYDYMVDRYPFLAFAFRGRIKSLIRMESKFNSYIVDFIYEYHKKYGTYPTEAEVEDGLKLFRDLIAYRIVISLPSCHIKEGDDKQKMEEDILYEIANVLPGFLAKRGFVPEYASLEEHKTGSRLKEDVKAYYRDYVEHPTKVGYQSLHITFYDKTAKCYVEIQIRTKAMDDIAEIGAANHFAYERRQRLERNKRGAIPVGECQLFEDAYERNMALQTLDLSAIDVNMFTAISNELVNDGCGLYRGRLIRPYEHLSRFQI